MRLRAVPAWVLSCVACTSGASERGSAPVEAQAPDAPIPATSRSNTIPPAPPSCPPRGGTCAAGFVLFLEAAEPWPLGRYFLRVARGGGPVTVCEIAFEPVVGAVTDTCNREEHNFSVVYRYDQETRSIDEVRFAGAVAIVDLEILLTEELPPLVEVHHTVVVQKCLFDCEQAAPLRVEVQFAPEAPSVDAGASDSGASGSGAADAAPDAAR